jgi:hypothetical protein
MSEIRRSTADQSLEDILSDITHSSKANVVVSCVGGRRKSGGSLCFGHLRSLTSLNCFTRRSLWANGFEKLKLPFLTDLDDHCALDRIPCLPIEGHLASNTIELPDPGQLIPDGLPIFL